MSDNVVPFTQPENQQSAEYRLNWVLEQVREGRVESVGIAIAYKDGAINTCWSETHNSGMLMGAVALLQQRLCRDE